ncbi:MAG TPA: M20/M25/M40 family metallo-hydrolase [Kofleriaceae bacterium]|nr:M20/M25/M40 family metallo-hydrolase [Kofleriaceae bacterium]
MKHAALMIIFISACSGSAHPLGPAPGSVSEPGGEAATAEPATASPTPIADQYREVAQVIIAAALDSDGAWKKLSFLTDHIGARLSGSKSLERAVAWSVETMKADGHENVRAEKVMVPHWERGAESAEMTAPYRKSLAMIGLGGTIATPKQGVSGEVVVVTSFEHMASLGAAVKGKIVLYDVRMPPFTEDQGSGYDDVVKYRYAGASIAAKQGAVAVLVRSLTAHSLNTPHTGTMAYLPDAPKIPAVALAVEDAELIGRLSASGQPVSVTVRTSGRWLPDAESANVIGELVGREKPDEVVVIGAHLDSWDIGQGAHDDGTGCAMMMEALTLLRRAGLRPRRTIRVVLFTNEENGGRGSRAYASDHAAELPNHIAGLESDSGGFAPRGVEVSGPPAALARMQDITTLLAPIGAARARAGFSGADIQPLEKAGVVGLGHWVDETRYFDYHHTHADTLDKVDPKDLARNVAAAAIVAYVIADMPERLGD